MDKKRDDRELLLTPMDGGVCIPEDAEEILTGIDNKCDFCRLEFNKTMKKSVQHAELQLNSNVANV